jgi:hypothetical protein
VKKAGFVLAAVVGFGIGCFVGGRVSGMKFQGNADEPVHKAEGDVKPAPHHYQLKEHGRETILRATSVRVRSRAIRLDRIIAYSAP